ncbi:MAG TPA: GNAT family N-acetyltransferase [Gammaproteobacteria bacterium]|nr:GNAT family N-acetyltransferase [Xanthomonadales bacterium]MCB1593897.1 GNAT family N-acetyltransferase [Xanthomonadales bacterium]HOP21404.1 GNAT family N-acetyltransferase [Gammaproteobacteria bacterium]HPI94686.1 GNAT family N-acetyltransferase [Gammaproteobacteria bacterium]HPQ86131.1 GNAT family N-acetyltransferase [Gammaproteobacteria bacterium]
MHKLLVKKFEQLSLNELYEIMALRMKVFCVEQDCPYQDLDGFDQQSIHVYFKVKQQIVAYARIIEKEKSTGSIGRVVVHPDFRKHGLAKRIMSDCIDYIKKQDKQQIIISAQSYLQNFYYQLGFRTTGKYYLEDDIPHEEMTLNL